MGLRWKSPVPKKRKNEGLVALTKFVNGSLGVLECLLLPQKKKRRKKRK